MNIKYKLLQRSAKRPVKAGHDEDSQMTAGINFYSTVKVRINSNGQTVVPTGVAVEIPSGYVGVLKARSGFAARTGLIVNAGVIDANYRGEVKVLLSNVSNGFIDIIPGESIAQMLILPVPKVTLVQVDSLTETARGDKGFGSTE